MRRKQYTWQETNELSKGILEHQISTNAKTAPLELIRLKYKNRSNNYIFTLEKQVIIKLHFFRNKCWLNFIEFIISLNNISSEQSNTDNA